jgi:hypothetical protein
LILEQSSCLRGRSKRPPVLFSRARRKVFSRLCWRKYNVGFSVSPDRIEGGAILMELSLVESENGIGSAAIPRRDRILCVIPARLFTIDGFEQSFSAVVPSSADDARRFRRRVVVGSATSPSRPRNLIHHPKGSLLFSSPAAFPVGQATAFVLAKYLFSTQGCEQCISVSNVSMKYSRTSRRHIASSPGAPHSLTFRTDE